MLVKLVVVAVLVAAAYAVFKLWRSGKAVTAGSVVAGVKDEVNTAVDAVKSKVNNK